MLLLKLLLVLLLASSMSFCEYIFVAANRHKQKGILWPVCLPARSEWQSSQLVLVPVFSRYKDGELSKLSLNLQNAFLYGYSVLCCAVYAFVLHWLHPSE